MFLPRYCILASSSANMVWRQGDSVLSDSRQEFIPISQCTACSNCIALVSRAYTGRYHEVLLAHKVIWMTITKLAMRDTLKTPSGAWVSSLILKENSLIESAHTSNRYVPKSQGKSWRRKHIRNRKCSTVTSFPDRSQLLRGCLAIF